MLTCIRSKRQRDAAEYALRTIQSSCIRPYIKTIYLYGSCARGEEKYKGLPSASCLSDASKGAGSSYRYQP